ncbi:hypothetical protein B0H13DRAFT_1930570 [Mycena leptocephala]|nr:hypothetical protein B0H13DRAFT_1930570 [Mycena leptocephala]
MPASWLTTEMDVHRLRAECMSRMGDIFLRRKNAKEADSMWLRAQELFASSSLQKEAAEIGGRRAQLGVKMPDGCSTVLGNSAELPSYAISVLVSRPRIIILYCSSDKFVKRPRGTLDAWWAMPTFTSDIGTRGSYNNYSTFAYTNRTVDPGNTLRGYVNDVHEDEDQLFTLPVFNNRL